MTTIINAVASTGLTQTADGSGIIKVQSNGVTTNALAWVVFDGTLASPTPIVQYNVASITKNGTGSWTVNFTNALASANNAFAGTNTPRASTESPLWIQANTTTSCVVNKNLNTGVGYDVSGICVVVFGQ